MAWGDDPNSFWNNGGSDLAGAGVGALGLILGGGLNDPYKGTIGNLNQISSNSQDYAKLLATQGSELLNPSTQYLKALISGDRNALLQATQPERRRVIDQYSAAKKTIGEFAPRGGGQSSALLNLQGNEAADLSGVTAGARTNAVGEALKTGLNEQQQGLTSTALGINAEGDVLKGLEQQQKQKSDTGSAWGKIAGGILTGLSFL